MLANFFLEKFATQLQKDVRRISNEAMEMLRAYPFPGNVRELENAMERAITLETTNVILPESLTPKIRRAPAPVESVFDAIQVTSAGLDLENVVAELEKRLLTQALDLTGGNKTEAAKLLRISFRSFRYRLQKYGLDTDDGTFVDEDPSATGEPDGRF